MKNQRHRLKTFFSAASAAVALTGLAAGIEWPTDFWQQVADHISAVSPTGDQVKTTSEKSDWDFVASYCVTPCGTPENQFDTRLGTEALSPVTDVESFPSGLILMVR